MADFPPVLTFFIFDLQKLEVPQIKPHTNNFNPNKPGGGAAAAHRLQISLVFLQFSSKLLKFFFDESCGISAFTKNFFEKLRVIEIGPRGR